MKPRACASIALTLVVAVSISALGSGQRTIPHSREAFVMGTRVVLTTYDQARSAGLARLERMLETIEGTEAELSTWRPDSVVSRLNAAAGEGPWPLPATLCALFADLGREVKDTQGAFDPAIGALSAAWEIHGRGRVPSEPELAIARSQSGWGLTRFEGDRCTIALAEGASIDVGAFGKGEALDRVRSDATLVAPWLIDLGGQVAVSGAPPDGDGWQVTVAHPRHRMKPVVVLTMHGGSLSTSAGSERDLRVRGRRVGHILDPRTGKPAPFDGSVSVWSERALIADVLSTALYVMGPAKGIRWADTHGVAAMFLEVNADGALHRRSSLAFARRFGGVQRR